MDEIDDLGREAGRQARDTGRRLAASVSVGTSSRARAGLNRKTRWIAAAAATLLVVAGVAAIAALRDSETVRTAPTDVPTRPSPTSSPSAQTEVATTSAPVPTTQATATSDPTQPTDVTSIPRSSSEAPTTAEPPAQQALEEAAIWPAADVVFDTPQAAADDFLVSVLGAGVLGEFQQIDARNGEIEVRSNADAPPGTTFPRALLQLRQLRPTDGWYVTSATSQGASISVPTAGAEVPAGPIAVEGEARGFESTLNIFAFAAGPDFSGLDDIDPVIAAGGLFEQTEQYSATVDLSRTSPGDHITILVRGDTGLSDDPGEFAAIPVVIAPAP